MTKRAKFLPSVVGLIYDWLRFEDYLGNVGCSIGRRKALRQAKAVSWGSRGGSVVTLRPIIGAADARYDPLPAMSVSSAIPCLTHLPGVEERSCPAIGVSLWS